ncbi:para-nitrobenzyl esterase [Saccharopolyspora antimicrobica]|uniref:Para-nitrobenzyl esterase n=1 Tax=Saccharopolyspora antimicrobica TaxID=455193 RepID=A0A1I4YXI7_9PSEU|nr:para-nitrobenzyl esterase [Saccharopolyspora antimicrobica]SFN42745.1 para-nitrobenzyl esterase [Saccharopolyspora antimicrobica]
MSSPGPTSLPLNRASGDRDVTQPQETANREINRERDHHCESRRGGTGVIELDSGRVRGLSFEEHRLFQGIPYAAPPVGELRWSLPRPVEPWAGVRDATAPGSPCPQLPQSFADVGSVDEDCLFLNVTAPRSGGRKPVMVWLHGGGGTNGEGSVFDARRLSVAEDVVVVTANYRLGIFGNFGYPGLPGGAFGIADQQEVLRWVQRNIGAFGGDPGNVTLFGESYGGLSIGAHLVAPGSAGLFHRAIVQSGFPLMRAPANTYVPGSPEMPSLWLSATELEGLAEHVIGEAGWLRPGHGSAVDQLRALPVEQLLQLSPVFTRSGFGNEVLPESPVQALTAGRFHRVPVLAGNTRDEARLFVAMFFDGTGQPVTSDGYGKLLAEGFDAAADDIAREYPLDAYATPSLAWSTVINDAAWARSLWDLAQALHERTPTYVYEFADRDAPPVVPFPEGFPPGAYHGSELPYQFDMGGLAPLSAEQWRLAATMHRYWANFARSGDPNGPGLVDWPRFAAADRHVQSLHPERTGPADFAADHRMEFWTR